MKFYQTKNRKFSIFFRMLLLQLLSCMTVSLSHFSSPCYYYLSWF